MSARSRYQTVRYEQRLTLSRTTKTLHSFSRLPCEVREKIWTLALPDGRIVKIKAKDHHHLNDDPRDCQYNLKANNHGILPTPLLHTCYHSRLIAQKHYQIMFGDWLKKGRGVYFDPRADTLLLEGMEVYIRFIAELAINRNLQYLNDGPVDQRKIHRLIISEGKNFATMDKIRFNPANFGFIHPNLWNLNNTYIANNFFLGNTKPNTWTHYKTVQRTAEMWAGLDEIYVEARRNPKLDLVAERRKEKDRAQEMESAWIWMAQKGSLFRKRIPLFRTIHRDDINRLKKELKVRRRL